MKEDIESSGIGVVPEPEVMERPKRRKYPADYKLKILKELKTCKSPREVGAVLRREGLYSSTVSKWRWAIRRGSELVLDRKRGRKKKTIAEKENEKLRLENARLKKKLKNAELIIEFQKKTATILSNTLESNENNENS
jgi:transposase